MKKFKKLIPAFCMLLVSAIMLGSSTFAWFSMNNKVTATGMSVEAKANTMFAVIAKEAELSEGKIAANFSSETATLTDLVTGEDLKKFPLAYNNSGKDITVGTTSVADKTFYTANSTKYDAAGNATTNENVLNGKVIAFSSEADSEFCKNYAVKYTVYLGISSTSTKDYTGNVKAFVTLNGATGVNIKAYVVVADATTGTYFDATVAEDDAVEIANNVTLGVDGTCVKVDIYLFIDGNSDNVKSSNTATINGTAAFNFVLDTTNF